MNALYLDANASEPLRPEARAALLAALDLPGNPSSVHGDGRAARRVLEQARAQVAARFGARPRDVVFTSGATEANAMALHGLGAGRRILASATEHPAILRAMPGIESLPVQADGQLYLAALEATLAAGGPALVCVMAANNETGVLQPLEDVMVLCQRHEALLHVDAVQAAGRVPVSMAALGADSMALSAHKMGGPKGVGALLLRPGLDLAALLPGGGQERGRRGGTEALPAIAGFGAAAEAADPASSIRLAVIRDAIEAGVGPDIRILGAGAPRVPNTTCLLLPGTPAETQVIALDLAGMRVSAGSACSSGKVAASHVLLAMGLGAAEAAAAIRVSLPWNAPEDAAERFLAAYAVLRARLSRNAA
jgi:cysteine desulfurase